MKKGQIYEGLVTRVDFPAKGIVQAGDEFAVVKNTIPGQKVSFRVNKQRKGKAEGALLEVLEQSPLETGHPCSHFGLCGGCVYLSMSYEEQLRMKEDQIRRLLEPVLERQTGSWEWEGIHGSPVAYEYRNKMEFSFGDEFKGGPLALGMHRRGSFYDLVTVMDCRIVDGDYRLILKTTRDYFDEKGTSFFHKNTHEGYLRHLLVRKASRTGEILVGLVTSSQAPAEEKALLEGYRDLLLSKEGEMKGSFKGILHLVNDSVADVVRSDRTDILYGGESFREELLGLEFQISTFSFFQTNSHSAEVLYGVARDYVLDGLKSGEEDRKPVVFDLYSGTGTIAQLIAPVADQVVGVEIVEEAVEAARENAARNGLDNCSFLAGDVLKVLDEISQKPDLIILDPPRDGIHPKALPKILAYGVDRIVYISCKPTSLARDLEAFLDAGYEVRRACCVDQFPWTASTEAVVLLTRS